MPDQSALLQQLLMRQPPKQIGEPIPLPEEIPGQTMVQKHLLDPVDAMLGAVGITNKTPPNMAGQLLAAAVPMMGSFGKLGSGGSAVIDAAEAAPEAPLAMNEASRMLRADKQGYKPGYFHATRAADDFKEFKNPIAGSIAHDFGTHVTKNPDTANDILGMYGEDALSQVPNHTTKNARVMPLMIRSEKTLHVPEDVNQWKNPRTWATLDPGGPENPHPFPGSNDPKTMSDIVRLAQRHEGKTAFNSHNIPFQQDLKSLLQERGYDTIKYPNMYEGPEGEPSYIVLDPRNIRSKFAAFDPAKFGKSKDIMASLVAAAGLGAAAKANSAK